MMTTGRIITIGADVCRGWAKIELLPRYNVTVHLVLDGMVAASTIADRVAGEDDVAEQTGDCWFELKVPVEASSRRHDYRVLVGESGEYLTSAYRHNFSTKTSASAQRPVTYRDALDLGLSASDVFELLYLDILRRPADKAGLADRLRDLSSGEGSFESCRRSLLESAEYSKLSLRVRDAPGGTFRRRITRYSSSRRRNMERHATAFQRLELYLRGKLLDFFPGLVAVPNSLDVLVRLADRGYPEREIFSRALSLLSERPSLIAEDRLEPSYVDCTDAIMNETQEIVLACSSPLFASGWNKLESPEAGPYRWMEQIGIIINPRPDRPIRRLELCVGTWYGPLDRTITVVAGAAILACGEIDRDGNVQTLVFTATGAPFATPRVALVAAGAACPWHFDGTPDMRLLSCQVMGATFVYGGEP